MKINVNDITLDVSVDGPGDAPVMIAHHGGPGIGSAVQVRPQFMPFSAVARVVTYDARGSGSSPLVPPYTHRQWAADVDAVRAGLGVDKIIMRGHSYGGFIALEYKLRYPAACPASYLRIPRRRAVALVASRSTTPWPVPG